MLFSEVYSCYYDTIAELISKAIEGTLDNKTMDAVIRDKAFAESMVDIPRALKNGKWPLIKSDYSSVIKNPPKKPLTLLEKRWLRSLLSDKRIKLFDISYEELSDVEPLFDEDIFVRFDVYKDGDPYDNPQYIGNFRTLLAAIKQKCLVHINYTDGRGVVHSLDCAVDNLEYSPKNDRFRVIGVSDNNTVIINLSGISECVLLDKQFCAEDFRPLRNKKELEAILYDTNNALDRAMICFSYLEKETIKTDDTKYLFKLRYFEEDESEIIIQLLSFGTSLRVVSPQDLKDKIMQRIKRQIDLCDSF